MPAGELGAPIKGHHKRDGGERRPITKCQDHPNRVEQKNVANFSDTCSVRADGLCIGSLRLVGLRKAGNSNIQEFFCTML